MNQLQKACFAFTTSDKNNVRELFSILVSSYQYAHKELKEPHRELSEFLSKGFSANQARSVMSELFSDYQFLRTDFLHIVFLKTSKTNLLNDLIIDLLKEVSHEVTVGIEQNTGYSSRQSLLTTAISTCYEPLFNEIIKCKFDLNKADRDLFSEKESYSTNTLFSEATEVAGYHCSEKSNANFAIHFLLEQPFANKDSDIYSDEIHALSESDDDEERAKICDARNTVIKINRRAILNLLSKDILAAKICAEHGYFLSEYEGEAQFSMEVNYAERTINEVIDGFIGQVDIESENMERDLEIANAKKRILKLKSIEQILFDDNAKKEKYLAPFFSHEFVMDVINKKLKEQNRSHRSGRGTNTAEKYSRTFDFFERLMGRESLIWEDPKHATRTLFALSKSNYAGYIVDHYFKKEGVERLAASATGLEQAKFVMSAFGSDPITVASLIEKESVRNQLIENITNL